MLILTRRIGQSISIGSNITVTVCEIKGGQVKIGIEAPNHIDIQRDDIVNKNKRVRGGKNERSA